VIVAMGPQGAGKTEHVRSMRNHLLGVLTLLGDVHFDSVALTASDVLIDAFGSFVTSLSYYRYRASVKTAFQFSNEKSLVGIAVDSLIVDQYRVFGPLPADERSFDIFYQVGSFALFLIRELCFVRKIFFDLFVALLVYSFSQLLASCKEHVELREAMCLTVDMCDPGRFQSLRSGDLSFEPEDITGLEAVVAALKARD
jgi:hypothetical protein